MLSLDDFYANSFAKAEQMLMAFYGVVGLLCKQTSNCLIFKLCRTPIH